MKGSGSVSVDREPKPWLSALAWALLAVAIHQIHVYLSTSLAGRDSELWFFFSSDTVQYGLLYKDLFDLGFHYAGWNISHAPEYLQMLWALLINTLSPNLVAAHVREALSQPVLLAIALHFLLRKAMGRRTVLAPTVVVVALTLISRGMGLDFIAIIWSNRHGFTALTAVLTLIALLDSTPSKRRSVTLLVLVALGVASDMLFVAWLVAPAIVAAGMTVSREHKEWVIQTLAVLLAGVCVGLFVFWLATPAITVGDKVAIDFDRALGSLGRMADDARSETSQQRLMNAILGVGFLVSVFAAIRSRRVEERLLACYAVVLPIVTLAAMALTSVPFREAGYSRYLLGPELAALTAILIGIARLIGRFGETGAAAIAGLALLSGFALRAEGTPPIDRYYPPLVKCVDDAARKHGLQYGVANYWLSKYVTALSHSDLSVVAVTSRLDPYVPFSNIEWFLGGVDARRHDQPAYTFAILGPTSATEPGIAPSAVAALGEPIAVETCFAFRVVVLPQGSNERLRAQFAQNRKIREYYAKRGRPLPPASPADPAIR